MKYILGIIILINSCLSIQNPKAIFYTEFGQVTIELFEQDAPITTKNFIEYVERKDYDSTFFYRTVHMDNQPHSKIKIEVIQGGLGFVDNHPKRTAPISHENTQTTDIKHLNGTLSMARADTGTATSEFFICINDQPELDYKGKRNPDKQGFAAFGKVISGMDIVHKIHRKKDTKQFYIQPVIIDSIRINQ